MDKVVLKKTKFVADSEGKSMLPLIHPGDEILIERVSYEKLKVNDIVVFQRKDKLITHRLIKKTKTHIIAKGDNNSYSDGKISKIKIVGLVKKIKRGSQIFSPRQLYMIQSAFYYHEILKVASELRKRSIKHVFLKGLPLHLYYQGEAPQRIYFDCDLMIRRENFQNVEKIVKNLGYKKTSTSFDKKEYLKEKEKVEISFIKTIGGVSIIFDVHFQPVFLMTQLPFLEALYPKRLIDQMTEDFLTKNRQITINRVKFSTLNAVNLIIYLALHFFHHNYKGGFRLELLGKVISEENIKNQKWLSIAGKIKKYQIISFVYPSFVLLKRNFKVNIPKNFFRALKPADAELIRKYCQKDVFSDESRLDGGINRFKAIFDLSQSSKLKKMTVFFNPKVVFFIFFALKLKLISFFESDLKNH